MNRKQLVIYRKTNFAEQKYKREIERVKKVKDILFDRITISENSTQRKEYVDYLRRFDQLINNLEAIYKKKDSTIPYMRQDIER